MRMIPYHVFLSRPILIPAGSPSRTRNLKVLFFPLSPIFTTVTPCHCLALKISLYTSLFLFPSTFYSLFSILYHSDHLSQSISIIYIHDTLSFQAGFEGERRDKILRTYVRNAYSYHLSEIFFTIVNEYTDWERTVLHPINTRDATIAALSDAQYVAPLVHTGDMLSQPKTTATDDLNKDRRTKSFFYVFDYQTRDGDYPQVSSRNYIVLKCEQTSQYHQYYIV